MEKMTHDYIRQVIPEEVSEKGGVLLRLVNGRTIPLETSIKEAKAAGYVLGDEELVRRQFEGLVQCMRDGTEADGMARQIGGWVTVYPVFYGPIDLTKGFDPEKNGVRIRMRLLNELDVDITDWEFRDVTPGRTPFSIDSASTGELVNTVRVGDPVHVNGRPFPSHDALRVEWAVEGTDKRGTVAADKFTSDATLITIAADALAELAHDEYDGKTIVFTVRGNFSSGKISASLRAATPEPHFDSATSEGCREGYVMPNSKVTVTGVGLRVPTADESFFVDMPEGKGRANFTDVSVSADGTTLTGHVGDWPEGAVPGNGYVVWLDTEGATIAVCEVEVGT